MDLNQLYFDHQISLMEAAQSLTCDLQHQHEFAASLIAGRIGCIQRALNAPAAPRWELLAIPYQADLTTRSLGLRA